MKQVQTTRSFMVLACQRFKKELTGWWRRRRRGTTRRRSRIASTAIHRRHRRSLLRPSSRRRSTAVIGSRSRAFRPRVIAAPIATGAPIIITIVHVSRQADVKDSCYEPDANDHGYCLSSCRDGVDALDAVPADQEFDCGYYHACDDDVGNCLESLEGVLLMFPAQG